MSVINELLKELDNEYASVVEDGIIGDLDSEWIDTGSYMLNAMLSGTIYGGISENKVTAFAGASGVGKTWYIISGIKSFLEKYKESIVFFFESESAITREMLITRGVDPNRVVMVPVITIQEFRHQAMKLINKYTEKKKEHPDLKMMMVLDSLGNLSTEKEIEDIAEGKSTRDMTRTQLIRGAFRAITLKMGLITVPMLLTNHTYEVIGSYVPMQTMSGGGGVVYASSTIVMLKKKKNRTKSTKEHTGSIITAMLDKGRITKEGSKVETQLMFQEGLNRYWGLIDIALKYNIVEKLSTQKCKFPDGTEAKFTMVEKHPEKYWTKEVLDMINEVCSKEFLYGSSQQEESEDE